MSYDAFLVWLHTFREFESKLEVGIVSNFFNELWSRKRLHTWEFTSLIVGVLGLASKQHSFVSARKEEIYLGHTIIPHYFIAQFSTCFVKSFRCVAFFPNTIVRPAGPVEKAELSIRKFMIFAREIYISLKNNFISNRSHVLEYFHPSTFVGSDNFPCFATNCVDILVIFAEDDQNIGLFFN